MVRVRLKKLTALLLSIAMVLSMFTNLLPAAYAEGEGVSTPADVGERDYDDIVSTRQPGLYIDFLGDNRKYRPSAEESATLNPGAVVPGSMAAPGLVDQNAVTNPGNPRTWTGYKSGETDGDGSLYGEDNPAKDTIFWIGVGIDKMDEFDLFQQAEENGGKDGVYSLELGFYYDNRYIEPYLGPGKTYTGNTPEEIQAAYQQVIQGANMGNYAQYDWTNYHIVSAETGLMPQTDPVTQETLTYNKTNGYAPSMAEIMGGEPGVGSNTWRMTYVAIERDGDTQNNRTFADGKEGTKYLLIIPFRLKSFDGQYTRHLCLRLVRNAGMFSVGGGEDGSSPYAAWERTTVRNPGRELKLMANFRGDLNIFDGQRVRDELYDAALYLDDGGGSGNTAKLSVDGDPSTNPAWVQGKSLSTRYIRNLPAGTGMRVDITVQTGYEATVSVYPLEEEGNPQHYILGPLVWNDAAGTFSFVMPDKNVRVDVKFAITDNKIFNLYLDEHLTGDGKRPYEEPVKPDGTVEGNETVLRAHYPGDPNAEPVVDPEDVTVDKDSPHGDPVPLDLPGEKVTIETGVRTSLEVDIKLHADYYAKVELYQVSVGGNIRPDNTSEPWFSIGTDNVITVTSDGILTLAGMPRSDMIVRVNYRLAKRVTGALEVWHENTLPKPDNVAQLRTAGYDDANEAMPAYSGVVYQDDKGTNTDLADDNHRAVKTPFGVLDRMEAQAAKLSGSLGGDGNTPVPWISSGMPAVPDPDSMMAELYEATSSADLAGKINAYDLRKLTGLTKGDGLRKNTEGEYYADSEMAAFYALLWDVKGLMDAEIAAVAGGATPTSGVSVRTAPDPNDSAKSFSYYTLTPDQLQAYLLDYEAYQADTTAVPVPVLRSDADAQAALGNGGIYGGGWYDPTQEHYTRPPTSPRPLDQNNGYKLETRVGRQMAVVLEASSVYTVLNNVKIFDAATYNAATGTGTEITTATRDPDYQNVYLFTVPDRDYIVKVTYVEREARKLNLSITIPIGEEDSGNETTVTAYAPDPGSTAARRVVKSKYTQGVETVAAADDRILVGSTVTVQVKKIPGYRASARVVTLPGSATVGTTPNDVSNLTSGTTVFTFTMPAGADENTITEIQITYTRDVETHNANLILTGDTGGSTGVWSGTTSTIRPSVEGDKLRAEITVQPGYYITAVEAYTAAGAFPFTLSGNGWNNGTGGNVTVDTIMPDAEYYVRVTFAKGPPPEEDPIALTLQVIDPDNTRPYVDNYAQAQAGAVQLGPVGLVKTGLFPAPAGTTVVPGSAGPATKTVKAGELVEVEYTLQDGFALESIVVEPVGLGITPTYVTDGNGKVRARFVMPSASARVVVTFRKTENIKNRLFLNLNKTENGRLATEKDRGEAGNTVTWVKSDTFDRNTALGADRKYGVTSIPATVPRRDDSAITTGVANPGEKVSFDIKTETGWYIHSLTVTDGLGSRLSYTLETTVGGEQVVTLTMPASDVNAIVNYRQGTPPDPDNPKDTDSDRLLELAVLDPDNTEQPYADNWTRAEVTGATTATLGDLGLAKGSTRDEKYVKPGDLVTIHYEAQTGYTMEVITVTTDGSQRTIIPTYTGTGTATFTMPDANVTAVVRFRAVTDEKPVQRYTANLILHFPAGVDPSDYDLVGEGTFGQGVIGADGHIQNRYYSRTALPGETIDFTAWAKDSYYKNGHYYGYYIQRVSVTPAALGVDADISGAFGFQNGSFVMPAADVLVNVFFVELDQEKEWPGEASYTLNLKVYDASGLDGTANFGSINGIELRPNDSDEVHSGGQKTLADYDNGTERVNIHEQDRVFVALDPVDGTYVRSITVTDSRNRTITVPWNYVPGGIAFDMPPAHVTVTVYYARRTPEIDNGRKHKVTLHIIDPTDGDAALLELASDPTNKFTNTHLGTIIDLFAGDTLTLTATPDSAASPYHSVVSAYAVVVDTAGGRPVVIPMTGLLTTTRAASGSSTTQTGMPLVSAGGTVQFAMPDADAEVYVTFIDGGRPEPGELTGSLMVMGPDGSGSAQMTAAAGSKNSTREVEASGGDALFAPEGTKLTVDLKVSPGFAISSIQVLDGQGNPVSYDWTDGTQRQFTLDMAPTGVRVYVELEKEDTTKDLTVQVVVNNGGGAGNTAKLRKAPTTEGNGVAILRPVHALDEIFLDLTVQTGYQIASIQVVPAKFGIAPSLTKKNTADQTTSFTMPGEDLVVYVHFTPDNRTRYTATLVTDDDDNYAAGNQAQISSAYSGHSKWVSPSPSTATDGLDRDSVEAAPATATDPAEKVTVNYKWDVDSSIASITVALLDGTPVPFTQNSTDLTNRTGEIEFPMVDGNVIVTVLYRHDPDPVGYDAVLHVIDMDSNEETTITDITGTSWASLTWAAGPGSPTTGQVTALASPGNKETLKVPAGQTVTVDADTVSSGVYLWAGYVIYRQGGQMINFNFKPNTSGVGFSGEKTADFIMHPGVNDVYVYFTKTPPTENDFSAVLMVDSPAGDTQSSATISTGREELKPNEATVVANTDPDHGYVVATKGNTITVTVNPAAGYAINSVLMTPLGIMDDSKVPPVPLVPTRTGNTYTFTMPGQNVAILVKLKTSSAGEHTATLHYASADLNDTTYTRDLARANLYFDQGFTDVNGGQLKVDENTKMTLDVLINNTTNPETTYLVLSAYVLRPDGTMVPLDNSLEGTKDTVQGMTGVDGTASFTMPADDVDVYVWFTKKAPADKWRTAVLVVTDEKGTTKNSGLNSARFWSESNPDLDPDDPDYEEHKEELPHHVKSFGVKKVTDGSVAHGFFWVKEGETVTVKIDPPATGYIFAREATISHSSAAAGLGGSLTADDQNAPEYVYTYKVGAWNSAVHAHFVASNIVQNPLDVKIIDPDNPGGDRNEVLVTPTSMTTLDLVSTTSSGARQRIPGVTSNNMVNFTVKPDEGYTAVAHLVVGGVRTSLNLTAGTGGTIGHFTMPDSPARLEITFMKNEEALSATLSIVDTRAPSGMTTNVSTAHMTENAFGGQVEANSGPTTEPSPATGTEKGVFPALPNGTALTAWADTPLPTGTKVIGGVLITDQGSRVLSPTHNGTTNVDEYYHTLAGRDAEIRILVGPTGDTRYIASVSAVDLPTDPGTGLPISAPTIVANPVNLVAGSSWTTALVGNGIKVTLTVPYGYRADVTVDGTDSTLVYETSNAVTISVDGTDGAVANAEVTLDPSMPARNVHITVTYVRTRFDATVATGGNGRGTATLTDGTTMATASSVSSPATTETLHNVKVGASLPYTATAEADSVLTDGFWTAVSTGSSTKIPTADLAAGTLTMPSDNARYTAIFQDPNDRHYKAYVVVPDNLGMALNKAISVKNTTESLGGGQLYAFGDRGDVMEAAFTSEPGISVIVKAYRDDTGDELSVLQQGFTGAGTATVNMPEDADTDVRIEILYSKTLPVREHSLSLQLVGAAGNVGNNAKLTVDGTTSIERKGTPDYEKCTPITVKMGANLDLDMNRYRDATVEYYIERVEITSGGVTVTYTLPDNNVNEYGTNATSLFTMPDGDTVVTVFFRLPYKATLFVVDAKGTDYWGDTSNIAATNVPNTSMAVRNTSGNHVAGSPTTLTHDPIEGLYGTETITTTVDETESPGGTLPKDTEVASVIASTSSGTVHLAKDATAVPGSGVYVYPKTPGSRWNSDVDVTVILRDKTDPKHMYTATVYKEGHDGFEDNWASIRNTTNPGLPFGTKAGSAPWHDWTGAYEKDFLRVDVTTHEGYYAVVTAEKTGSGEAVPVLQWAPTGTAANPATAEFYMPTTPGSDVDVTVTYSQTPPKGTLELVLTGHKEQTGNMASVNDMTTPPGALIPPLTLAGSTGALDPLTADSDNEIPAGTALQVEAAHMEGYSIKSITITVSGYTPPFPLKVDPKVGVNRSYTADTTMPVVTGASKAIITVTLEEGQKTPRPFDPTHSTIYNGTAGGGDYPTDPTPTDPGNPNLSNPDQEGWILAEVDKTQTNTIVVTIPTLYEAPGGTNTLEDAGVDEASTADPPPVPPTYTFYWVDSTGTERELDSTQMTVSGKHSVIPGDNHNGNDPTGGSYYGYQVTLTALAGTDLETYIRDGGTIYVTAKKAGTTATGGVWAESEKTQVIIPAPDYTATLHIVDVSSSLNNEVEMSVKDDTSYPTVTTDGGKIEKLHGKETLLTKVTRGDPDVKVVSVLAIPKKGSPSYLPADASGIQYPFPMVRDDVDIVVTLANGDDELYTATVVKDDPANEPGNTVKISNPTHPVLNRDTNDPARWTLAYVGDEIRVDATAALGYRAVVTAVRKDTNAPLTVNPDQGAGAMVITLPDKMPASNIKITVTFEKVEDSTVARVTLQMRMNDAARTLPLDPGNSATATDGTVTLLSNAGNGYSDTRFLTAGRATLSSVLAAGYQIHDVVMSVNNGTENSLGAAATGFTVTGGTTAVVTVLLEEKKVEGRTPRPFDPAHSDNVNYSDALDQAGAHPGPEGHQDGYLLADNQGNSLVEITVPNLYDGDLHPAVNVAYTLYARINGVMVELKEGTDYDTVKPVAAAGYPHTANGKTDWEGQVFTIQSLDPTSALGEYVRNGGIIYITATAPRKNESAYTEVVIPIDPNKNKNGYTVFLKIIDDTKGATINHVRMQNANSGETVAWDTGDGKDLYPDAAGQITKLLGGELIRTQVTPGAGVTYTVMAHTASRGDVLLFPDPTGTHRYLRDMPTEDMEIIVHFRADEDLHIAAVEKRGATAVEGNEAYIENTTDGTLNKGTIWTEGRTGDKIQVKVTTAEGYYATVSISYQEPGQTPVKDKVVVRLGSGTEEKPLLVDFDMPNADVQVVVLFERGQKSPRPYDPKHSETYYSDQYQHYTDNTKTKRTPENQSTTDQEGWLLGENLGGGSVKVTIPTLWGEEKGLENATGADFHFYLPEKDATGAYTGSYILLEKDVDYVLANSAPDYTGTDVFTVVTESYRYDQSNLTDVKDFYGVTFRLLEVAGGQLDELLDSGLSLFVSATKRETAVPPWVEGDMTELVIPSTGLRPFDPDRENDPNYNNHWIRAENRGDYLIVTVPLLNSPREDKPTSVDDKLHRFQLHLQKEGTEDRSGAIVNVTDLLKIENVKGYDHPTNVNLLYDETWDPTVDTDQYEDFYENEIYNKDYREGLAAADPGYTGARFIVTILSDAEIDADTAITDRGTAKTNAQLLRDIFDNEGTMGDNKYRMYITSDETERVDDPLPTFRTKDYVDFEVPQYYSLIGALESYAPKHTATFSLYRSDGDDPDDWDNYEAEPAFVHRQFREKGMGLWQLNFVIKSSELMGEDRSGVTYKLVIEKPGHVTRTWANVVLSPDHLDPGDPLHFSVVEVSADEDGQVVTDEVLALFGGDVNQDGYARLEDYDFIMSFFNGGKTWSRAEKPNDADWSISVYNPESMAHQVDLDGDGYITVSDAAIWNDPRNHNQNYTDYPLTPLSLLKDVTSTIAIYEDQLRQEAALLAELEDQLLADQLPEGQQPAEGEEPLPPAGGELPDGEEPSEKEDPSDGESSGTEEGGENPPQEDQPPGEDDQPEEPEGRPDPPEGNDGEPDPGTDPDLPASPPEEATDSDTESGETAPEEPTSEGEPTQKEPSAQGDEAKLSEDSTGKTEGENLNPDISPLPLEVDEKMENNENDVDIALKQKGYR